MRIALLLSLAVVVTGCSPFRLINGLSPSGHYELTSDIAYGVLERQSLDIYVPRDVSGPSPLVVFFYGGGWRDGSKKDYEFVASSLTKAGYTVIIPDYRLFPNVVFPTFVEDGAAAVAWSLRNAGKYGANSDAAFIMGHSAGAHIAGLLVTDQRYLDKHDINTGDLKGFVGLSGPYDFLPIKSGYLLDVFPIENRDASQAINFASAQTPSSLLIHGTKDDVVYAANSENLSRRLAELGVDVTLRLYKGAGHAEVVAALAPPLDFRLKTLEDSLDFLATHGGLAKTGD